jgi:hypothetical protein
VYIFESTGRDNPATQNDMTLKVSTEIPNAAGIIFLRLDLRAFSVITFVNLQQLGPNSSAAIF